MPLKDAKTGFAKELAGLVQGRRRPGTRRNQVDSDVEGTTVLHRSTHGDVVIAAITSCTNTSNPSVLMAAGLLARNAARRGLQAKPWVKTSLAPGSQVVTDYSRRQGSPSTWTRSASTSSAMAARPASATPARWCPRWRTTSHRPRRPGRRAVLSGNRNFEGRVHAEGKANYLASPPLVVAYALTGTMNLDLTTEPLGKDKDGKDVFLKDIWPSTEEIADIMRATVTPDIFAKRYSDVFEGDEKWQGMGKARASLTYAWDSDSTYVHNPPYFEGITMEPKPLTDIVDARVLGLFGDSITTDHISPAGSIKKDGLRPAPISSSARCVRTTSTRTARAAATTRS